MSGKSMLKIRRVFLFLTDTSALQAYLGYTLEVICSSFDLVPLSM